MYNVIVDIVYFLYIKYCVFCYCFVNRNFFRGFVVIFIFYMVKGEIKMIKVLIIN